MKDTYKKEVYEAITLMGDVYAELNHYREIDRRINEILQHEAMSDEEKVEAIKTARKYG